EGTAQGPPRGLHLANDPTGQPVGFFFGGQRAIAASTASASRAMSRTMSPAGLTSFTNAADSPHQSPARSMSPTNAPVGIEALYRRISMVVPSARRVVPMGVPSPGRWPGGGWPAASHS